MMMLARACRSAGAARQLRSYSAAPSASADPVPALRNALKDSMRAKDRFKGDVIKSLLADLQTAAHQAKVPDASKTMRKAVTQREKAIKSFLESSPPREDLAEQYRREIDVLKAVIPPEALEIPTRPAKSK